MARKVLKQTCNVGGLEAPRNSLELPVENSYCVVGDNIPYSYEVRHEWPEHAYTTEASMKKLINEEISKQLKPRRNAPNVVARLMGMDTFPFDEKSISHQPEKNNETRYHTDKEQNKKGIGTRGHYKFSSLGHEDFEIYHHDNDIDNFRQIDTKEKKPKPREHPQEEELQKFKKEFEAWQAARFKECSKVADLNTISDQLLAQETLNKEKAALYANSSRMSPSTKQREVNNQASQETTHEGDGSRYQRSLSKRSLSGDFDESSAPMRIVVLRPGPERMSDNDDSRASSLGISEERGGLENFLDEVKERLKCELLGKIKKESMVRGGGIETRYSEKVSNPKQIAQRIANQVRESVTRDLAMNLLRSESTRSYRSDIDRYNESSSPEFFNRGTRIVLAERLRNVLKGETNQHKPKVTYGSSDSSSVCNAREIEEEQELDMQNRSFSRGLADDNMGHKDIPPRNLIRSLSAPISGASFGKLLLEDRHVLTGAHIRRKHEDIESVECNLKKQKKKKLKFRERVSSIKYSFTLKGRLFGRKIQSEQPQNYEYGTLRDIRMGPTVMMNYMYRHENCTEVPPSPASVCGSVHEEFWRETDYLSSTISDMSSPQDTTQIFREISSNLSELRRQLKELDGGCTKEAETGKQTSLSETKLDDDAQAYIRDLIVASGLHRSSSDKVLSRWDPMAKPISNQVFEEVEESYEKRLKDNEVSTQNHKLLYGLLNEALSVVLGPPMTMSRFRTEAMGPTRPPRGKKLLDCVWEIVSEHLYPPSDKSSLSLDGMVARDLGFNPWCKLTSDEIDALGKEIESQITECLIIELVKDISSL